VSVPAQKSITARSAGTKGLVVKGTIGGANIFEIQDTSGVVTSLIDSNSNMVMGRLRLHNGTVAVNAGARLLVETYTAQIASIFKGGASQTADLTQWQDASAVVKLAVRADGIIKHATSNTGTTVGATGAASVLPAMPVGYLQIDVNGTLYKMPYYNN
jgi:hypothetical protein